MLFIKSNAITIKVSKAFSTRQNYTKDHLEK
jgi:hypothetical protein